MEHKVDEIKYAKIMVSSTTTPVRIKDAIKDSVGNLSVTCAYCPFKKVCWGDKLVSKEIRTKAGGVYTQHRIKK